MTTPTSFPCCTTEKEKERGGPGMLTVSWLVRQYVMYSGLCEHGTKRCAVILWSSKAGPSLTGCSFQKCESRISVWVFELTNQLPLTTLQRVIHQCNHKTRVAFELVEASKAMCCHMALWVIVLIIFMFCWLNVQYYGMLQIELDSLLHFEKHTHL